MAVQYTQNPPPLPRRSTNPLPQEDGMPPVIPMIMPELQYGYIGRHQVYWNVNEEPHFVDDGGPWEQTVCMPAVPSVVILTDMLEVPIVVTPSQTRGFVTAKDVICAVHRAFQLALSPQPRRPQQHSALFWGGHEGSHVRLMGRSLEWVGLCQDWHGNWGLVVGDAR
ncbi:hypothetical protein D9611_012504 [Ephemerocybe angulata]|uniref:DUF6699 domain-containing protein n=1 Tax=Ephemerocybe angulata TaxID=980116 RepID=A0A8H5FIE9_9AGAR|nr:hypothetical protein D9611_012504 [Tulosesus angulatus]